MEDYLKDYKETITTIGELQEDDLVMGDDGQWHRIKLLDIHIPKKMYKITFENGFVKCSGDHQWNLYGATDIPVTVDSDTIFKEKLYKLGLSCGRKNGPKIVAIKKIKPEPVRCIHVLGSNLLFEILVDNSDHMNDTLFEVEREN